MPGTGAYYWVPLPTDPGHHWVVYTSRDAGLDPDVGHTELWLLERLTLPLAGAVFQRKSSPEPG